MKLYLDDIRIPSHTYSNHSDWILVRSPLELLSFFSENYSQITHISFDHDLNWYIDDTIEEITGYSCLKSLCDFMIDKSINPNQYTFYFHTANPVGKQNMETYWNNFRKYSTHQFQYDWKKLELEYENIFKNSYGLTVCNLKPKLSDLKLETIEIYEGLVELWYSSKQEEGLFYYYFNYDNSKGSYELLESSHNDILSLMVVPTVEVYDSVIYEKLN